MGSVRAAIDAGVGIECDLRLSRDGFAMLFHDSSLERLCRVNVEAESLDAAALMQFRLAGSGERIASLGDVLAQVGGRVPLLLELKRRANGITKIEHLCRATLAALGDYRGPVGVMSFDPRAPAWLARHAPHVRRGLVISDRLSPLGRWTAMRLADPQFLSVHRALLDRPWVARARRRMPVTSWTIRTAAERRAAEAYVDVLIWEDDGRPRA